MEMMELDGIDGLFGIDGLKEDLMDVGVIGASAGVSVVAGEFIFAKYDAMAAKAGSKLPKLGGYAKAGVAVVLGAAGGVAAGRFVHRGVGAGVAAGLIGWGVAKSVQAFWAKDGKVGQMSDRDLLLGADTVATDYLPMPGQTNGVVDNDVSVSDYRPLPGQTDGLGQATNVAAHDMESMPGQSGSSGFMQGIGGFLT